MHPPPLFQDTCSISSILLFRSHPPNQTSSGDAKEGANLGAPAKRVSFSDYLNRRLHSNFVLPRALQLIEEFTKKENISFDGGQSAEVLLARDASPSGEALLEAAKQGICSVVGTIFHDMGILTSPQLHWLVHARNKGRKASEHDYFQHLSYSYRCLVDLIPKGATIGKVGESLVVDGANGVEGDKIEALKDLCDGLAIKIRNTSKGGGILDQGVGIDFIQEHKIVPSGFGSSDAGFRPLSKTVRFNVLKVIPVGSAADGKKAFTDQNRAGWWDYEREGVDNDEVGATEVLEGMGSTTLGEIIDCH